MEEILIYDIETATSGERPDANTDKLRVFGAYSYITGKYYTVPHTNKEFIQKIIDGHKFLVGFNNTEYDDIVLKNAGYNLDYKKIVDLRKIFKNRAGAMSTHKGMLGNVLMKYSLDYITRFLDIVNDEEAKGELDYSILRKDVWSTEEITLIKKYTKRDLEITKKLYEWLENYFSVFKEFVRQEDIDKKNYLTDSIANFAYKAICHALGWEPSYNKSGGFGVKENKISGGYVAFPSDEKIVATEKVVDGKKVFENPIIIKDFNSLYPHIMMMANLYGRNKAENKGWNGNEIIKTEGFYNNEEIHPVGKLLRKFYYQRLYYKRKGLLKNGQAFSFKNAEKFIGEEYYYVPEQSTTFDLELKKITPECVEEFKELHKQGVDNKEYTIKIIINTCYGLLDTPYYEKVCDSLAAGDCTRIARQMIKYARKRFRDEGYKILYTDSVTKDSMITLNNGQQISIEYYWNNHTKNKFVDDKETSDCLTPILSCDDNFKNVFVLPKRIIRHKTKKKIFEIELTNCSNIKVTEDHSLITVCPETNKLVPCFPKMLTTQDTVIVNNIVKKYFDDIIEKDNADFFLARIKNIKTSYIDDYVYDFSVDKYERFYANNILVHNTDSWFFVDVFNNEKKYLELKDRVIKELKEQFPFPQPTFDAGVDAVAKSIFFFKGSIKDKDTDDEMDEDDIINKNKGLMKKNYIYVTTEDKIVIKNLGIRKKNISALTKKIFWDYMTPRIKKDNIAVFDKKTITDLMIELLSEDISLAVTRKEVGELSRYTKSQTSFPAQVSAKYGAGIHFLIPVLKDIGVGKQVKYCTMEDYVKYKLSIKDIDLSIFWNELDYFIKKPKKYTLFDVE